MSNKGSKYQKKQSVTVEVKNDKPSVNVYTSDCCEAGATKAPCAAAKDSKAPEYSKSSLGTWKCSNCAKTCKVSVSKRKVEVSVGND